MVHAINVCFNYCTIYQDRYISHTEIKILWWSWLGEVVKWALRKYYSQSSRVQYDTRTRYQCRTAFTTSHRLCLHSPCIVFISTLISLKCCSVCCFVLELNFCRYDRNLTCCLNGGINSPQFKICHVQHTGYIVSS